MAEKHRCPKCGIHWTIAERCWHCKDKEEAKSSPYKDVEFSTWKPRKRKVLQTEKEQAAIRKAVDERHRLHFEAKQYQQGTPEFEAVVKTLTPIERITRRSIELKANEVWGR